MIRALILGAALAAATPAIASQAVELAQSRLRSCLLAGSSGPAHPGLEEAVISVRAFCAPQIKRVREHRIKAATAGLSGEARQTTEQTITRALNDEIALAIANFTGLTS